MRALLMIEMNPSVWTLIGLLDIAQSQGGEFLAGAFVH